MDIKGLIEALESCLTWAKEYEANIPIGLGETDEIFFQNLDLLQEAMAEFKFGVKNALFFMKIYFLLDQHLED